MVNPRAPEAEKTLRTVVGQGIRGLLLFPALHSYFPDDDVCRSVYETARQNTLVVFVHLGGLKIAIRDRLGISQPPIDERFGDPKRLARVLQDFPDVAFLVPHFGCGTLEGLLASIGGARNLYLDTSSSNSWMTGDRKFPNLDAVFRAVLEHADLGPARVLFGSDSTVFPRGFRADVYQQQAAALQAIGAPAHDREAIFGGNFERLLPV
jgi:predicted TIM-barrel fold metal-dependent hydrolase